LEKYSVTATGLKMTLKTVWNGNKGPLVYEMPAEFITQYGNGSYEQVTTIGEVKGAITFTVNGITDTITDVTVTPTWESTAGIIMTGEGNSCTK